VPRLFAATYDLGQWPLERLGLRAFRRRAVSDLTGRVLEIGAGTGLTFPHYRAATMVVAVEPDPAMRARAAARVRAARVPVELVDARAEALPFAGHVFDAAVSTLDLCSVDCVARTRGELRRVLRPGSPVRDGDRLPTGAGATAGASHPLPYGIAARELHRQQV